MGPDVAKKRGDESKNYSPPIPPTRIPFLLTPDLFYVRFLDFPVFHCLPSFFIFLDPLDPIGPHWQFVRLFSKAVLPRHHWQSHSWAHGSHRLSYATHQVLPTMHHTHSHFRGPIGRKTGFSAKKQYFAPYGDSGRFDVTGWSGNILRIELDPVLPSFCLTE